MTAPVGKGVYCIMTCRVLRIDEQLYGCEELPAGRRCCVMFCWPMPPVPSGCFPTPMKP